MKNLLVAVLLLFSLQGMCQGVQFISEIKIFAGTSALSTRHELEDEGYQIMKNEDGYNADLNDGGGGHYIYLGYKTSIYLRDAITNLLVVSGGDYRGTRNRTVTREGYTYRAVAYNAESDGGNLNRGRGSAAEDLFLYYSKDVVCERKDQLHMTTLTMKRFTSELPSSNYYIISYPRLRPANLNEGGDASKYLYLMATYHNCTPHLHYEDLGDGRHIMECSACDHFFGALDHSPANKVTTRLNDKQCYNVCACGYRIVYDHDLPRYKEWNRNETQHYGTCMRGCGQVFKEEHDFSREDGVLWLWYDENEHCKQCKVCMYEPTAPHTPVYKNYSAEDHVIICTACDYPIKYEPHENVVDQPAVAPTCTEAGHTEARRCRLCNRIEAESTILPATGHKIVIVKRKNPNCTYPQEERHYHCTKCGQLFLDADGLQPVSQEDLKLEYGPHLMDTDGFCALCNEPSVPALNEEDNYYEISKIGHLYWYAQHGCKAHNARLMQDITDNVDVLKTYDKSSFRKWTALGYLHGFAHVFDGQGHTISGIYAPDELVQRNHQGLFAMNEGVIKNLTLVDSYFLGGKEDVVGSICGANYGTVTNCISSAEVYSNFYCGGICSHNKGTIKNCAFIGKADGYLGAAGLVVDNGSSDVASIEYCYSYSTVKATPIYILSQGLQGYPPSELVCHNHTDFGKITHCYSTYPERLEDPDNPLDLYSEPCLIGPFSSQKDCEDVRWLTPEQFASGEACWLLNNGLETSSAPWRQTIEKDMLPTLLGPTIYRDHSNHIYTNDKPKATVGRLTNTIRIAQDGQQTASDVEEVVDDILERK